MDDATRDPDAEAGIAPAALHGAGADALPPELLAGDEPGSLVDLVNRVLDRGVVVGGDVTLSVAGVDLVYLQLGALLTSVSTARRTLGRRGIGHGADGGEPPRRSSLAPGAEPRIGTGDAESTIEPTAERTAGGAEGPTPRERATHALLADTIAAELAHVSEGLPERIDIDPDAVQRDLARLVLVIVELLRRVVEHQAIRRMDDDDLTEAQVERMGSALQRLEEKLGEIKRVFGLADADLNIELGPLGKLL